MGYSLNPDYVYEKCPNGKNNKRTCYNKPSTPGRPLGVFKGKKICGIFPS
jgi:hypothetical protein